ncbi:uncharacterized protein I303_107234 [Kwoniella dejecticola CBS 10117]|uniref:Peptidase A1 domain-containing protein n=1 Tax=Kwoniella dejecticola CBS 10117 TaxID=1296121 RepID=A0A1A5ZZ38_9TREE|nr:uncharacterized protein I303_06635 [Kwoniella dejecticola CBS 10117]OBR83076.1 hypothetical protein I303_06635 [Kwoniella dejecticola CBS 10117]
MEITLDDPSPMFRYGGVWVRSHEDDDRRKDYFGQSYYSTNNTNDWVSLTFNGTGITVYGAKRSDHGMYKVRMDDVDIATSDGYSSNPLFQQAFYTAEDLSADREHTIIFTNTPSEGTDSVMRNTIDIDYAVIKTATTGTIHTSTFDDTSSTFSYTGSNWVRGTASDDYYATTRMVSRDAGDVMQFAFSGTSVALFGGVNFDHSNFTVVLDGVQIPNSLYNGTYFGLRPQTLLWTANNLPEGPHSLSLTNIGGGKRGQYFDFDYAIVNSTVNPNNNNIPVSSTTIAASNPVNSSATSAPITTSGTADATVANGAGASPGAGADQADDKSSHVAAIAGGAAGAIGGLALIAVLAWFLFRRKRIQLEGQKYTGGDHDLDLTGQEVKPFHNGGSSETESYMAYQNPAPALGLGPSGGLPYPNSHSSSSSRNSVSARENDHSQTPFLSTVPAPPGSNVTSYPASSTLNRSNSIQSPQGGLSVTFTHNTFGVPTARERTGLASEAIDEEHNDPPLPLPPAPRSQGEKSRMSIPNRLDVEGREQDMGPYTPNDSQQAYATLPPDYTQATQPFSSAENEHNRAP